MTDRTSAIAEAISQDKDLTKEMLRAVGVPVPEGRPVSDADDAWAAAEELEGPVVVKPRDADHGDGITMNLFHARAGHRGLRRRARRQPQHHGRALRTRAAPSAARG